MALLSIHPSQVAEARARGFMWEARVEFRGSNANNSSGQSQKFWSIESIDGDREELIVRWGRIGTNGQSQRKPYRDALNKMQEKLSEGYRSYTVVLPEPYCRIATIVLGKAAETFVALDKDNILVMNLSRNGVSKIFEMAPHIRDASPSIIL